MVSESWLKKRWKTIRNDHRTITIYNHVHNKKLPLHRMAKYLDFIRVDLNGAKDLDFKELKRPRIESFCVTQTMLDNCDINESVTADSISVSKFLENESKIADTKIETPTVQQSQSTNEIENILLPEQENTSDTSANDEKSKGERCEDTIFGELVVAMLKKMKPEEKKRAKKEIMNILL